jgi:hypothetical protein
MMQRRSFIGLLAACAALSGRRAAGQRSSNPPRGDGTVSVDLTPQYLAVLPERSWGDVGGVCVPWSVCVAMETRAILTHQSVPEWISVLDLSLQSGNTGNGTNAIYALQLAQANGVCRESLYPFPAIQMSGGVIVYPPESATAVSGRRRHKVVSYDNSINNAYANGGLTAWIAACKHALDQGYPLLLYAPPNHMVVGMGYYDRGGLDGFLTWDVRGPGNGSLGWSQCWSGGGAIAVTAVAFNDVAVSGTVSGVQR